MNAEIQNSNEQAIQTFLKELESNINYEEIKNSIESKFIDALEKKQYNEIIKIFNEKNISKSIGTYFGLKNAEFCSTVLALLQGNNRQDIINALKAYLPNEIPR